MDICYITAEYPPQIGGVGDYVRYLSGEVAARGHGVTVVTSAGRGVKASRGEGRPRQVLPVINKWNLRHLPALIRALRTVGADVYVLEFVVFMYGRGGVAPWLVAFFDAFRRRVGRPLILNVHEIYRPRRSGVKGTVLSWMSRKCYEAAVWGCASAVVTNSYRERLLRELPGVDSKRVTRIPVGTNIPAARIRSRASRDREELYITSFGLWNQDRAIEELVHAVSAVTSPRPLRLFLVGGYGNEERRVERIRRLAAELGLEGRVEITGPLSAGAVSGYLARSDIFVSPEAAGPSGRRGSLIAAYAHGLPVVAYDGREREDVFRDGDNIIVVPEGDASSLATAVERLAGNDALRRTMGERARATFDEYFAWPRIAEQWDREVFVRVAEAL